MDVASLFAARRGVEATIVLTPANAALIRPTLQRSTTSDHPVELLLYPFSSEAAGLPSGVENLATVSSEDDSKFTQAVVSSREAHDRLLQRTACTPVVTDLHFWWITGIAADIGILSISFQVIGAFPRVIMKQLGPRGDQDEQLREMALGLEASGMEFLWVVRSGDHGEHLKTEWMPEGWEERVKGKGLLVRGVWDGFRSTFAKEKVVVPAEAIERVVRKFMEGSGTEGEEMRKRAAEWAEIARAAVAEGGSSHKDLNSLIDELFVAREKTKDESQ
ncbi:hypothetical protein J5N97_000075 [Dioscorea zingiberensis]|uniref:Uncharacterized protein n=1 Tax=Dioscorea zingiberensis TaxID=325984 RepID=A0A9D5H334_9LILI|nr:hypothetical protein J5N97_000075 [Dioscorea zingiberensis]